MNIFRKKIGIINVILIISSYSGFSQALHNVGINARQGLYTENIVLTDSSTIILSKNRPLFSFLLNNNLHNSSEADVVESSNQYTQTFENVLIVNSTMAEYSGFGLKGDIVFENSGKDTISISNVVPFGEDINSVYITGQGPSDLARVWLFRPGFRPVRVILPDNAWELGFSSFYAGNELSVCALARRTNSEGGQQLRYETLLPPKAKVVYSVHAEVFKGEWQNGLRLIFRDRYLYDLEKFDNSLYEREDLNWIKDSYLIILKMAWDREFYDRLTGKYNYTEMLNSENELFGNIDVFGICPTWPMLGIDQRDQRDLYKDLPGGTEQLKNFAKMSRQSNTRLFFTYDPLENSTGNEDQFKVISKLIGETEADGVVLKTSGSSSFEIQSAADIVRKGVIMYSEGMAITKDMPAIIAGGVHSTIFLSPELNLNKLIKPDFSIFRVCDVGEDLLHREIAIAFFNGYGTELNMFRPGKRDDNFRDDLEYLARTTFILRQNNDAFLDSDWTPMVETTLDNVYVNRWKSGGKTIYTVLNMKPEGVRGKLFKIGNTQGKHFVSVWNHENIIPVNEKGTDYLTVSAPGWDSFFTGTRKEGSVDCIAELPVIIKASVYGDSLKINKTGNGRIFIWKGNPSYKSIHKEFRIVNDTTMRVKDLFGLYEGKIVLQLIENKRLKDENILEVKGGKPWIISISTPTKKSILLPPDMVLIPGATFKYNVSGNEDLISYPEVSDLSVRIDSFLLDKYPVTNSQYFEFVVRSGYKPADTTKYLRHWQSEIFKNGQDKYPVVYVAYEDMKAYARWAEKRLPTEAEWQLAAQGLDKRKWPWGDEFHGTYCNNSFLRPTPVDAFSKGQSPYGAIDMVGNIWQMTNDMYFNGTNYMTVIRGGSYYKSESSRTHLEGGPQALDKNANITYGFARF